MICTKPQGVLGPTTINIGCNLWINLTQLWDCNLKVWITTGTCLWRLTGPNIEPTVGMMSYLTGTQGWWQGMITGGQTLPLIVGDVYTLTVTFQNLPTYYATWQAQLTAQYEGSTAV